MIALAIGAVIFLLVEGVLVTSLIRFRRRRGGPEPAQIRGNTPLEVGWTIGAVVILIVLAAITFAYLSDITTPQRSEATAQVAELHQPAVPGGHGLKIGVNGQQSGGLYGCLSRVMRGMQFRQIHGTRTRAEFDIGI